MEELPKELAPARLLLKNYSGIKEEEVDAHIRNIRDKAWAVAPYGCIGHFRFLNLDIVIRDPRYQETLTRLTAPGSSETFLDVGCCVGQVIRQLSFDGVNSERLFGMDLQPEFLELGHELFQDREKSEATFVPGNIFDEDDEGLKSLDGKMDIVQASSFFHLFDWDGQVKAAKRIVKFFKPDIKNGLIFGRMVGSQEATIKEGLIGNKRFIHNKASLQCMFDEVGTATGTKWKVEAELWDDSWETPMFGNEENKMRFGVYQVGKQACFC